MVGFTLVALAVGVVGNVLSRTLVLDAVALWPLAALVVPAAIVGVSRGRRRALAPLVLLTWLLVTVGAHLGSVEGLPSGAATVEVDLGTVEDARLVVAVPEVALTVGDGPFIVRPAPIGGRGGPPVVERVAGERSAALTITDAADRSWWFRFGAYDLTLPTATTWTIEVTAASIEADLTALPIAGGRLEASSGQVELGRPAGEASLVIAGNIEITLPADVAATVTGAGDVPSDWTVDGERATSPATGSGWLIVVQSGSVRITTR